MLKFQGCSVHCVELHLKSNIRRFSCCRIYIT